MAGDKQLLEPLHNASVEVSSTAAPTTVPPLSTQRSRGPSSSSSTTTTTTRPPVEGCWARARRRNFVLLKGVSALLVHFCIGLAGYIPFADNFSQLTNSSSTLVDAVYFSSVTMTTVGFGDIYPNSPGSRIFVCAYIFLSIGFISYFLSEAASYLLRAHVAILESTREELLLRNRSLLQQAALALRPEGAGAPLGRASPAPASGPDPAPCRPAAHPRAVRAARALLMIVVVVGAGACFFRFAAEEGSPRTMLDCVYYAVVMV